MKKLLFLAGITSLTLLFACNDVKDGQLSANEKKNLEINQAVMKAYEAGDFSKMGDYIAADAVDHGGENGDVKGLDSIVSEMKRYRAQMTEMKSTIIQEVADRDYVYTWSDVSGKQNGSNMKMSSVDVTRFKDGKAVEHWIFVNPADMMKMMMGGSGLQPAAPVMADTVAKK